MEREGCKTKVKMLKLVRKFNFRVPPTFYKDGKIDVVFERISGSFATAGPNSFKEKLVINLAASEKHLSAIGNPLSVKIYDASGRLIRQFNHLANSPFTKIIWDGTDENRKVVPGGIYFILLDGADIHLSRKIILIR